MKKCTTCGQTIPQARLDALPTTTTCIDCSEEQPVQGHVYWDGKHTPVLEVKASGTLPVTRKGFHAQLPFNSTNNSRMVKSMANLNLSLQAPVEPSDPEEYVAVQLHPARCHPDRPRINPRGDCLECAQEWYARRRQ